LLGVVRVIVGSGHQAGRFNPGIHYPKFSCAGYLPHLQWVARIQFSRSVRERLFSDSQF
jgi:hypothetical protein